MTDLYRGDQVSICPPPLTTNWWPLDQRLRRFNDPTSFLQSWSAGLARAAAETIEGCSSSSVDVPIYTELVHQIQEFTLPVIIWQHTLRCCCKLSNSFCPGKCINSNFYLFNIWVRNIMFICIIREYYCVKLLSHVVNILLTFSHNPTVLQEFFQSCWNCWSMLFQKWAMRRTKCLSIYRWLCANIWKIQSW